MVWITGGEPSDRNLTPLLQEFADEGLSVAIATSGVAPIRNPIDWLSVSPHSQDLQQMFGNEIKVVPNLNGLDAEEFIQRNDKKLDFWLRFLQPLDGDADSLEECIRLWKQFPRWGISIQTHKIMGLQ